MKALIVDDDLALADVLSFTMRRAGYEVVTAHDGQAALDRWESEGPDIIILDINMPKLDGLKVCQRIRAEDSTPIIFLSVRGEEDDVVQGLELGADDYIVKPFSPRQLVARSEAVLRRAKGKPVALGRLEVANMTLDSSRNELQYPNGKPVKLTPLEVRLLESLMLNHDQVLTFDVLIDAVWGQSGADKSMLKQLVYRLRRKIENDPSEPTHLTTMLPACYLRTTKTVTPNAYTFTAR